jgi:hypothetical protein
MALPARVTSAGDSVKLTGTSSMPCASWSLPAVRSCPAAVKSMNELGRENAICGSCYATKGFYRMGNVRDAQQVRMDWITSSITEGKSDEVVSLLSSMIREDVDSRGEPIFRVHDSGDIFSIAYADIWHRIASAMPDVQFWIPTRSWVLPRLLVSLQSLDALPNVVVRPSALGIDDPAPVVPGLSAGTTVSRSLPVLPDSSLAVCPKTDPRDGRSDCGDCRNCWEGSSPVTYLLH